MKREPLRKVSNRRRGATAVLVVVTLPVLIGMATLAVDVGYMHVVVAETQNAADAGALAGISVFTTSSGTAQERSELAAQRAREYVGRNVSTPPSTGTETNVQFGTWDADTATFNALTGDALSGANAVRIVVTQGGMPHFFANFFGKSDFSITREAVAAKGSSGDCKLWARDKVEVKDDSRTDSYDSSLAPYDPFSPGSQGHVCSCDKIEVNRNGVINGDAAYAEGGEFDGDPAGVTGAIRVLSQCLDPLLPSCAGVAFDNYLIGLTDEGEDPFAADDDDFGGCGVTNSKLEIKNDNLTIPAGTYYFETLELKENATLYLSGPTTIYIGTKLEIDGSRIVNPSQNPHDLTIIHAGEQVHLKDTMSFYGYIVAPNANIEIEEGTEYFGGIIGKEVELKGDSRFHADQSLPLEEIPGPPVLVR